MFALPLPDTSGLMLLVFGLCDTNTQFGIPFDNIIGPVAGGPTSLHAPHAAAALESLGLSVMASYPGYRKNGDDMCSWYSAANETWVGIDVIASSQDVIVGILSFSQAFSNSLCY